MDGGLNVDGAAVPSDTEETGDSAGLPGDEATMAEPARDTSSIMGKRSEQLSGRKRYPIFPIFCLCVFAKNSSNRYGLTTNSAANKEII